MVENPKGVLLLWLRAAGVRAHTIFGIVCNLFKAFKVVSRIFTPRGKS
jgi:hypothetical protein